MGDSWMKLNKKQTTKRVKVRTTDFEGNEYEYEKELNERCYFCSATDCVLYGKYGTYNEFGSFYGICEDCLKRINDMASVSLINRLHRKFMNYIDNAKREIHFTIEQKRFISKIFGKIKKELAETTT